MILRPSAAIIAGEWQEGLEFEFDSGALVGIRATSRAADDYVLSPAFVNAHSHLEYRGLQGKLDDEPEFFGWIRRLTELKVAQSDADVRADILVAAQENRATGVALIGEHADRVGSGEAMAAVGLDGIIFQEVITFREREDPIEKLAIVAARALEQARFLGGERVVSNPHSLYTVDEETLRGLFCESGPRSIHVAESVYENQLIESATGPFAELERKFGFQPRPRGVRAIEYLNQVGGLRAGTQIVHACDVVASEIEAIRTSGASIAHCPRSNRRLDTPIAPIREYVDAGISVGLGLDSAASSGPIDMFEEMRGAMEQSMARSNPVSADKVWRMATSMGAESLGWAEWDVKVGSRTPMIKLQVPGARSVDEIIRRGKPEHISWIETPVS